MWTALRLRGAVAVLLLLAACAQAAGPRSTATPVFDDATTTALNFYNGVVNDDLDLAKSAMAPDPSLGPNSGRPGSSTDDHAFYSQRFGQCRGVGYTVIGNVEQRMATKVGVVDHARDVTIRTERPCAVGYPNPDTPKPSDMIFIHLKPIGANPNTGQTEYRVVFYDIGVDNADQVHEVGPGGE